jgi:hypothetical protein
VGEPCIQTEALLLGPIASVTTPVNPKVNPLENPGSNRPDSAAPPINRRGKKVAKEPGDDDGRATKEAIIPHQPVCNSDDDD